MPNYAIKIYIMIVHHLINNQLIINLQERKLKLYKTKIFILNQFPDKKEEILDGI
jgi:hypothetical protein